MEKKKKNPVLVIGAIVAATLLIGGSFLPFVPYIISLLK
jgi:hypothetical protein